MADSEQALFRTRPRRVDVPLLAIAALSLLAVGVTVPAMTFDNLFGDETFSVLSGIEGFATSGNLLLALLLLGFSVVFPAAKVAAILVLWFAPTRATTRRELTGWLELLGKWSLLDAFVIAVLIGTVQLGILSAATAEPGVYLYLSAIVLSLVATFLLRRIVRVDAGAHDAEPPQHRRAHLLLTVPAAVCYGVGLSLPLLEVEKGWFWSNRFSLLQGIRELFEVGDWGLGLALVTFVVALPTLRFVLLISLRLARSRNRDWTGRVRLLDQWSMAEVFVLALLVVFTKLGALATPDALAGMWLLLLSAALTFMDSLLLHRRPRRDA